MNAPVFPIQEDGVFVERAHGEPARFGAFDTLLVEGGRAWFAERHLARLRATCERFALPACARRDLAADLACFVAALDGRTALVRTSAFTAGAGPLARLEARVPRVVPAMGIELLLLDAEPDPLGAWKTTERAARDRRAAWAEEAGAFEALQVLPGGEVLEAARANVFACVDDVLVTPPLARGVLPGIVRGILLERLPRVAERSLSRADLGRASEVFLTSSGLRVAPVRAIRGLRADLAGPLGPAALRAAAALAECEADYAVGTRTN